MSKLKNQFEKWNSTSINLMTFLKQSDSSPKLVILMFIEHFGYALIIN